MAALQAMRLHGAVASALIACLTALDVTGVAVALPRIAEHLHGLSLYPWVVTAHVLALLASAWICGAAAGRIDFRATAVLGTALYLAGCAMCALSGQLGGLLQSLNGMEQLVCSRVLQGLGSGALIATAFPSVTAALASRWVAALFVAAAIAGAGAGSVLVEHGELTLRGHTLLGWQGLFYVNLPLVIAALPLLLSTGADCSRQPRSSLEAPRTLHVRIWSIAALSFVVSAALLGSVLLIPLYLQCVVNPSPTFSGLVISELIVTLALSSLGASRVAARARSPLPWTIVAAAVLVGGLSWLGRIDAGAPVSRVLIASMLVGAGAGALQALISAAMRRCIRASDTGLIACSLPLSRRLGAAIGLILTGLLFLHILPGELPKYVPELPRGTRAYRDLAHAQSLLTSDEALRARVRAVMDERLAMLERAIREDAEAARDILADPRLPESLKRPLRDGGIRAGIRGELIAQAEQVDRELRSGSAGRDRLLEDDALPGPLKQQLAAIPARALRDPELMAGIARLFHETVLAREDPLVGVAVQSTLRDVRAQVSLAGELAVTQVKAGLTSAFSKAVALTFERLAWLLSAASLLILLLPRRDLRISQGAADQ